MPRKEYKTITVKAKIFTNFMKEKSKSDLENSDFLKRLLQAYKMLGKQ
jgi:hypothetical protein